MPRLTPLHWKELESVLFSLGYALIRQTASHRIYWKSGCTRPLVVNVHGKKLLQVDVISSLLKTAGITRDDFLALLGK
ncbi:MAG: type II toxin-antitoxin system HicA family toxin [Desulfovibrio sp.]|nr:type II toxin-antitoxin system HicA family toxin [Desulfovibrio sp.]